MSYDFLITTMDDLLEAIEEYGIVPYFSNSIPGFSIEEHVSPSAWFTDVEGVWEWKGPVIRQTGCAYGKFFERKAAFVRRDIFADLANFRRDGYDYEGFFNDGFASLKDKRLYDLIEQNGPILSKELKALGNYKKGGAAGFDTSINRLQAQCFVQISNFVYMKDRFGKEYGWGVAEYAAPEQFMGLDFADEVYCRQPEESRQRLEEHIAGLFPSAGTALIQRFLSK